MSKIGSGLFWAGIFTMCLAGFIINFSKDNGGNIGNIGFITLIVGTILAVIGALIWIITKLSKNKNN